MPSSPRRRPEPESPPDPRAGWATSCSGRCRPHAFESCVEQLATAIRLGVYPPGSHAARRARPRRAARGVARRPCARRSPRCGRPGWCATRRGRRRRHRRHLPAAGARPGVVRRGAAAPSDGPSCSTRWLFRRVVEPGAAWPPPGAPSTASERLLLAPRWRRSRPPPTRARTGRPTRACTWPSPRVTGSPRIVAAVTEVQASLHELLRAIPVLEANIAHSDRQHDPIVGAILVGDPAARPPRHGAALRRHRRAAARSARRLTPYGTPPYDDLTRPAGGPVTRNDRHLTSERLRDRIDDRRDRHRRGRLHRHAGAAAGQAAARRATSSTRSLGHGTEGCNYLLAVDVDMNTVDGYAITSWERGYGDMEFVLDLDTLAGAAAPARPPRWSSATSPGSTAGPVVAVARARSCARQLDRRRRARAATALAGTELEFIVFEDTYEAGVGPRTTSGLTPANQYNVDYSILGTARVEPLLRDIRNTMYAAGHGRRGRQGRVQPRPARDRLPLRRGARHRRQPRRLQDRRQGDRRAARAVADLHGEVRRARGQLLPHPPVAARHATARSSSGTTRPARGRALYDHVRRRRARDDGRLHPALRARTSTPTSASPTARSRRRRSPGARTTAPAPSASSATAPRPGWRTACPAGDVNPYLAIAAMLAGGLHGVEHGLPLEPALEGNAYTSGRAAGAAHPARGPRRLRRLRARPRRPRRRGRRPLREHGRRRARGLRVRRSPTGSGGAASKGCEHAVSPVRVCTTAGLTGRSTPEHATPSSTRRPASRSRRCARGLEETDAAIERGARGVRRPGARVAPGERAPAAARVRRASSTTHLEELARLEVAQRRAHHRQRALGGGQRPRRA